MFIYHFNRLIRSRILWGFFAIIISVMFVAAGSCSRGGGAQDTTTAGKINGKKISTAAFEQAAVSVRGIGRNRDTETPLQELDRKTWEQIAAMQVAQKNGFTSRQEDVRDVIRSERAFQGQNGFEMARYRAILREQDLFPEQYENLVKNHILMMKISALIETAAWISPVELDDEIAAMTDTFTVQVATLSNQFAAVEMRLSDEDYKAFYDEHQSLFVLPDRISVRYIAVPVSNYLAQVTVAEDDLRDYYDANLDMFKVADTNDVTGFKPFDDVRDEILAICQREEALFCAETNLTFTLYDKLATTAPTTALEALAAIERVDVQTSALFAKNDQLSWAPNAKGLAAIAFDLDPENSDMRFGIMKMKTEEGNDVVLVFESHQTSPTHVPLFADVEADVKQYAQEKARTDAFDSYIKEMRADILKLMDGGKTFSEAAIAQTLNVSTSLTYSVSEMQSKPFENSYSIAYGAMALKKGDLSEAVPTSASHSLLIYVMDRQRGDALAAELMRSQVRERLARYRNSGLFSNWLTWNLSQQRFESSRTYSANEDEAAPPQTPR